MIKRVKVLTRGTVHPKPRTDQQKLSDRQSRLDWSDMHMISQKDLQFLFGRDWWRLLYAICDECKQSVAEHGHLITWNTLRKELKRYHWGCEPKHDSHYHAAVFGGFIARYNSESEQGKALVASLEWAANEDGFKLKETMIRE